MPNARMSAPLLAGPGNRQSALPHTTPAFVWGSQPRLCNIAPAVHPLHRLSHVPARGCCFTYPRAPPQGHPLPMTVLRLATVVPTLTFAPPPVYG